MSATDNYQFYEFDTEDGRIYTYKKANISIDHKTGTIITDDEFGEMRELFTGMECELLNHYESPQGRDGYSFSLHFIDTECSYRVGRFSILDYRCGEYKDLVANYRELSADEFIKKVKPLLTKKDELRNEMKSKIMKKSTTFIKQKEEYIKKQEELFVAKKEANEEANKILKLFIYH